MDNLKKYLQENIHQLDDDLPSKRVWKNVVNEITVDNKSSNTNTSPVVFIIFKYAVAACVIALAGIGVWHLSHQNTNQQIVYVDNLNNKQVQVDSDYANVQSPDTPFTVLHSIATNAVENIISTDDSKESNNSFLVRNNTTNNNGLMQVKYVDSQFNQMISVQKNAINSTPIFTESPEYFKEFKTGYKQIEQDEKNIKQDILRLGFTDELLEQLININQHKLNLLKMLQTEINKTNIRFKQNRNQLDSAKMYYVEI